MHEHVKVARAWIPGQPSSSMSYGAITKVAYYEPARQPRKTPRGFHSGTSGAHENRCIKNEQQEVTDDSNLSSSFSTHTALLELALEGGTPVGWQRFLIGSNVQRQRPVLSSMQEAFGDGIGEPFISSCASAAFAAREPTREAGHRDRHVRFNRRFL